MSKQDTEKLFLIILVPTNESWVQWLWQCADQAMVVQLLVTASTWLPV